MRTLRVAVSLVRLGLGIAGGLPRRSRMQVGSWNVSPEHVGDVGVVGAIATDPGPCVDLLDELGASVHRGVVGHVRRQHLGGESQTTLDGKERGDGGVARRFKRRLRGSPLTMTKKRVFTQLL